MRDTTPAATLGIWGRGTRGSWVFSLDSAGDPVAIDSFPSAWGPAYSPDGRWIAYTSNESAKYGVYVAATDHLGERQKISLDEGEEPVWTGDGRSLVYRWGQAFYSVAVPTAGSTTFGSPREILRGPYINAGWSDKAGRSMTPRGPCRREGHIWHHR
jgi:Tol biopolymer transport system component